MKDHRSYKFRGNNSGLNVIWTHDRFYTGAVLLPTELSSQLGAGYIRVYYEVTK